MEVSMNTETHIDNVRQVDVYRSGRKNKMKDIHDKKDANARIQLGKLLRYFGDLCHKTHMKYI